MIINAKHQRRLAVLLGAAFAALSMAADAQGTKGLVDDARLLAATDATDRDWITFGQDYRNQRFSSLSDINRTNVGRLLPAWIFQSGEVGSHQTNPLVVDGVIYFTTPSGDVIAADAATGTEQWRYRHKLTRDNNPRGHSNRGAAVAYGKVFEGTDDGRVNALDQATGKVIWSKTMQGFVPPASLGQPGRPMPGPKSFVLRAPPLAYDGMVIMAAAGFTDPGDIREDEIKARVAMGGDVGLEWIQENLGRRGFVFALDAQTGNEIWRFYLTKEDGWEGDFTANAPDGTPLNRDLKAERELAAVYKNAWASASVAGHWTPAVDPSLGLIFIGTGNVSPTLLDLVRPGDNLYSNGIIALEAKTGKFRWFFQAVPHGMDHDVLSTAVLFDAVVDGRTVPAVGGASRAGSSTWSSARPASFCSNRSRSRRRSICSSRRPRKGFSRHPGRRAE